MRHLGARVCSREFGLFLGALSKQLEINTRARSTRCQQVVPVAFEESEVPGFFRIHKKSTLTTLCHLGNRKGRPMLPREPTPAVRRGSFRREERTPCLCAFPTSPVRRA